MLWNTVAPPSAVVAVRTQRSASAKYCFPLRSKAMSVSPPPGGSMMPVIAVGAGPGVMIRNVWPRSTEPNQVLRCVPVPVGPLTKIRPEGSIAISGSAVGVNGIYHGRNLELDRLCQQTQLADA